MTFGPRTVTKKEMKMKKDRKEPLLTEWLVKQLESPLSRWQAEEQELPLIAVIKG